MQRFTLLILLISFQWGQCIAQDSLFILHPVLGEIIDRNEKKDYLLFPEIADSIFNYCYIKYAGDNFFLHSSLISGSVLIRPIDTIEIKQYEINVEKLSEYYSNLLKNDSIGESEKELKIIKLNSPYQIQSVKSGTVTNSKWSDENRANQRLKHDAELRKMWRQGNNMDNAGGYIDFTYAKKRRK